jgi:hypothetical protein
VYVVLEECLFCIVILLKFHSFRNRVRGDIVVFNITDMGISDLEDRVYTHNVRR